MHGALQQILDWAARPVVALLEVLIVVLLVTALVALARIPRTASGLMLGAGLLVGGVQIAMARMAEKIDSDDAELVPNFARAMTSFGGMQHALELVGSLVLLFILTMAALWFLFGSKFRDVLAQQTAAAGAAALAHAVGYGLILSHVSLGETQEELVQGLVWLLFAVAVHQLCVIGFRAFTTYDDQEQIQSGNVAASISYGGIVIGVALIAARALDGDTDSFSQAALEFAKVLACCLLFFPLRQLLVQGVLLRALPTLRGGKLDLLIGADRNVGAALLEGAVYTIAGQVIALSLSA
jgi:uncharacterized membrane protein YjfL (UPF0719 family)